MDALDATLMSKADGEMRRCLDTLEVSVPGDEEYVAAAKALRELQDVRQLETKRTVETYKSVKELELASEPKRVDPNVVVQTVGAGIVGLALIAFEAFGSGLITSKAPDIVGKLFKR